LGKALQPTPTRPPESRKVLTPIPERRVEYEAQETNADDEDQPEPQKPADFTGSEWAVLRGVSQFPSGATRAKIAVFSGRSKKSSSFDSAFPKLAARGLITCNNSIYEATAEGKRIAGTKKLPRGRKLLEHWLGKLDPTEKAVLTCLFQQHPAVLTRQQVSDLTGRSVKSSTFDSAFPTLVSLELMEHLREEKGYRSSKMLHET
jgi:hypothetical protein